MNELGSASGSLVAPQAVSVAIDSVSEWPPHPPTSPPFFLVLPDRPPAFVGCEPIDVKEGDSQRCINLELH